ncbi:ASCH domain-containing protein [Candidatus Dependentiae bacterium]|nr:ASCH domain-containing protein [Candidatus Dependentiae bacterium]
MIIKLSLMHKYFENIKSGKKTIEGRLNKEKYQKLKINDKIEFKSNKTNEKIICKITHINKYSNFKTMLINEGINNMLPKINNLKEAIKIYESIPGYKENVKKYGTIAIGIKIKANSNTQLEI